MVATKLFMIFLVIGVLLLVGGCAQKQTSYQGSSVPNPDNQYKNSIGGGCGFAGPINEEGILLENIDRGIVSL